jgi:predicted RNase H-like HicB family nuclease
MMYPLDLEEMEGRWVAHVQGWPGAFASAEAREAAIAGAPAAIADYFVWISAHGEAPPRGPIEAHVDEVHRAWVSLDEYEVNAFFHADRAPLTEAEIETARTRLLYSRADLLDAGLGLLEAELETVLPGERWSINGILKHVADGENWYLDRFGHGVEAAWNIPDALGRLVLVRQHLLELLPSLAGSEAVVEVSGELWSPRKLVRRALWHERDHTAHIHQLRARLRGA